MPEKNTEFLDLKVEEEGAREAHIFLNEYLRGHFIAPDREKLILFIKRLDEKFGKYKRGE